MVTQGISEVKLGRQVSKARVIEEVSWHVHPYSMTQDRTRAKGLSSSADPTGGGETHGG